MGANQSATLSATTTTQNSFSLEPHERSISQTLPPLLYPCKSVSPYSAYNQMTKLLRRHLTRGPKNTPKQWQIEKRRKTETVTDSGNRQDGYQLAGSSGPRKPNAGEMINESDTLLTLAQQSCLARWTGHFRRNALTYACKRNDIGRCQSFIRNGSHLRDKSFGERKILPDRMG